MQRVVHRGRLRQAGEERCLAERQLLRMLREVRLSGSLDPVGVVAVVDLVHVLLEDPVFGPAAAELDCEAGLLELPLEGSLLRDVEVAHQLLRDRRAALDDMARAQVLPGRSGDALVVDPAVLVEAVILDRHGRLPHPGAHAPELDRRAVPLCRDRAEQRAVGGEDEGVLTVLNRPELVQIAVRAERGHRSHSGRDHRENHDQEGRQEQRLAALALDLASFASSPRSA